MQSYNLKWIWSNNGKLAMWKLGKEWDPETWYGDMCIDSDEADSCGALNHFDHCHL
jgi:hypothetical protein